MNPSEEQLFGRDDWWEPTGSFRPLHDINPLRLHWAESVVGSLSNKRLFDLGCGGGLFTEAAALAGARAVGVDASAGAIAAANRHAATTGVDVTYRQQYGIGDETPSRYDIVTCFEMLEHVDDPAAIVADSATLLAPGGIALFSTINRTARAWALLIAGLEVVANVLPIGTHCYSQFIKPAELAHWCRQSGLSVMAVVGLRYSFFGRTYLLDEHDTAVNYFLAARRTDQPRIYHRQ